MSFMTNKYLGYHLTMAVFDLFDWIPRYRNHDAITNPDLKPWVKELAEISRRSAYATIESVVRGPKTEAPEQASRLLEAHSWATAARAICKRAWSDSNDAWRNALPPDRKPIILIFEPGIHKVDGGTITTTKTRNGYKVVTDTAADYIHENNYEYWKTDHRGRHLFLNTVSRINKNDPSQVAVGHELVTLIGAGRMVSQYLGNDGRDPEIPARFREVRFLTDLKTAIDRTIEDCDAEMQRVGKHKANYLQHRATLG